MSYRIIEKGNKNAEAEYSYECECGNAEIKVFKISEDKPDKIPCSCGKEMTRNFGSISFPFINGRLDPNSCNFWKKGKSSIEIAKVLSNEKEPY